MRIDCSLSSHELLLVFNISIVLYMPVNMFQVVSQNSEQVKQLVETIYDKTV